MISRYLKTTTFILLFLMTAQVYGWEGMPMPKLHVEGRYLKDSHGHMLIYMVLDNLLALVQ
jgi:hypothetical protein